MEMIPSSSQSIGLRKHIPELDGLRGIAILMVMCHHLVLWRHQAATCAIDRIYAYAAETGWLGVDIFFVLSGFLITGILLDARNDRHFFRNFYARRVLRIFPVYYLSLTLVLVVFPLIPGKPYDFQQLVNFKWSYWLYLSNFTLPLPQISFSQSRLVTWSLAIEEQFYLVWPAIIWFCRGRWIVFLSAMVLTTSIASRIAVAAVHGNPDYDYYWTPCHLDGLATGAMLAAFVRRPQGLNRLRRLAAPAAIIGLAGIALCAGFSFHRHLSMRQDSLGQIPLYTFASLLGASLIALGLSSRGIVAASLRHPLPRFFGKYSYSLYLFHIILLQWVLQHWLDSSTATLWHSRLPSQLLFLTVNFGVSILLALLSWNLIERHFLKLKSFFPESGSQSTPKFETAQL